VAESPDDRVLMVHPEASPDEAVEVSRFEYEGVWKASGWKLQSKAAAQRAEKEK
jgi:hypothetical protein